MFNYIDKIIFKNYHNKYSMERTPHNRGPSLQFLNLYNLITKPITAPNPWSFISNYIPNVINDQNIDTKLSICDAKMRYMSLCKFNSRHARPYA